MKSTVMSVTPEMAVQWLTCNKINRPLRPARVANFAGMITRGEWRVTHQGIALDADGNLLDGQHRLSAIVATGEPVRIMVTTGLDPDVFGVLDRGLSRSLRDIIGDSVIYIAITTNLWKLSEGMQMNSGAGPTPDQYLGVKEWADLIVSQAMPHVTTHKHKLTPAAVITGAAVRLMQGQDRMHQLYAMSRMDFGAMVPSVQALCRQLISELAKTTVNRADVMARAYRAFDPDNTNLTRIQINDVNTVVAEMRSVVIPYAAAHSKTRKAA